MACGAIAGGVAAFLTTPFDFVKTRIMLEGSAGGSRPGPEAIPNQGSRALKHTANSGDVV